MTPAMHPERNAIRRGAIDAVRFEAVQMNAFQAQRARRSDGVPHRRLLDIRRDDAHLAKSLCCFRQRYDSGAVNAVII